MKADVSSGRLFMRQRLGYEVQSKALLPFMTKMNRRPDMKTTNRMYHAIRTSHSPRPTKSDHSCLAKERPHQLHSARSSLQETKVGKAVWNHHSTRTIDS